MVKQVIALSVLSLLLAACGATPVSTLVVTSVPAPTSMPSRASEPISAPTAMPTSTLTLTETPEPTSTPTSTPTPRATPLPIFTLSGVIFFDYNGNGIRDENEPPITGATVQAGSLVATTSSDGVYSLQVPAGTHSVKVSANGFHYISLSLEAFQSSQQPVTVRIEGDTRQDWGLMQGFLTLPYPCGSEATIISYFDLDATPGLVRDYRGRSVPVSCCPPNPYGGGTYDQHRGIDFALPPGTPIVASAGGVVSAQGQNDQGAIWIDVRHPNGVVTSYGHVERVLVGIGDRVSRG